MENEIKVNDYVRLKDGTIAKVIEIKNQNTDIFNWYCLDNDMGTMDRSIVKHSPNLIDLIEEGDYVNGKEVIEVFSDSVFVLTYNIKSADNIEQIYINQVKKIVTHEQFESISYKVTKM